MKNEDLYQGILRLEPPWQVAGVELDVTAGEVRVEIENSEKRLPCPLCKRECPRHDVRHRRWRHLDTCDLHTVLLAAVPRIRCPVHGVKQVPVPWAERDSRFTALFEARVISWLHEASISAVAELFELSWGSCDRIMREAVRRGLKRRERRLPCRLGIDETSFQKRHEYVTVISDQRKDCVVHVADGRTRAELEEYLGSFDEEERSSVETVAIDMWPGYISAIESKIPEAESKICFDKFHVAQHLGRAVDAVRRQEHKKLLGRQDHSLKGSKHLWLANAENLSDDRLDELDALSRVARKTAKAWLLKELAMDAWRHSSRAWARTALLSWYRRARRSQLQPMIRVAGLIKAHLVGLVNAVYHGVTNARAEGINSRIQWIKYSARGFRSRSRFRTAIYFHLGKLDMRHEIFAPIEFHTT